MIALLLIAGCALHKPWVENPTTADLAIAPGKGAGNVHLGMRTRAVERRIGPPATVETFAEDHATYWTWPELGLSVQFQRNRLDSMFFYSGVRGGYETRDYKPFPGRTAEGVSVFANVAQVMAAYGDPDKSEDLTTAPVPARWFVYDEGLGFTFLAAGDKMIYMCVMKP